MLRTIILTFLTIASINTMKSFKLFLTEQNQVQCDINGICKVIKEYESAGNEEKILSVYKDSKGLDTVGHGHLVTKDSPKIFSELNISPDVLRGKSKLKPEEADKLLKRDVEVRVPQVKKLVPGLATYSPDLQAQITSEHFRGMLGKSPKTVALINKGEFEQAANEFLNAKDYRESVAQKTGIAGRMKNLSDALKKEAQLRKRQQSGSQTTQAPANSSTSQSAPSR
jgi:GH24 family phage-related lysozyme (muramidase)